MDNYGLIGKNIGYSFSKDYFTQKFSKENIPATYRNFDLKGIEEISKIFKTVPGLRGLNVTIPYKEAVLPLLDSIHPVAAEIGAVNTIRFNGGKTIGYNTDHSGFLQALEPFLKAHHRKALILGTGGASKAVAYVLKSKGITFKFVSRTASNGQLSYSELNKETIEEYKIIINSTPLGTFPQTEAFPEIPYQYLGKEHLLYDLIYNPSVTRFLSQGGQRGATVSNGYKMLVYQAEKAWEIWNS